MDVNVFCGIVGVLFVIIIYMMGKLDDDIRTIATKTDALATKTDARLDSLYNIIIDLLKKERKD